MHWTCRPEKISNSKPDADVNFLHIEPKADDVAFLWVGMTGHGFGTLTIDYFDNTKGRKELRKWSYVFNQSTVVSMYEPQIILAGQVFSAKLEIDWAKWNRRSESDLTSTDPIASAPVLIIVAELPERISIPRGNLEHRGNSL